MNTQDNTDRYLMEVVTRLENLMTFMRESQPEVSKTEAAGLYEHALSTLEPLVNKFRDFDRGKTEAWKQDNSGDRHSTYSP